MKFVNQYKKRKKRKFLKSLKEQNNQKLKTLQAKIIKYSNIFPLPDENNDGHDMHFNKIETNSCYDMKITDQNTLFDPNLEIINNIQGDELIHDGFHTSKKLTIYPNKDQKKILIKWFDAYVLMYNRTTKYFKKKMYNKQKIDDTLNYLKKILKRDKYEIMIFSFLL